MVETMDWSTIILNPAGLIATEEKSHSFSKSVKLITLPTKSLFLSYFVNSIQSVNTGIRYLPIRWGMTGMVMAALPNVSFFAIRPSGASVPFSIGSRYFALYRSSMRFCSAASAFLPALSPWKNLFALFIREVLNKGRSFSGIDEKSG